MARVVAGPALGELGRLAGEPDRIDRGFRANEHPPRLRSHDRYGHRIDEVEYHPAWHQLPVGCREAEVPAGLKIEGGQGGQPVSRHDDRPPPSTSTVTTEPERRLSVSVGGDGDAHTNLVMGFDLSLASRCALEVAADLARRLDARLHVVHVIDLSDYPIDPDACDWEEQAQRTLALEKEIVGAVLKTFNGQWTYHAWHGQPAALLARVADEYDAFMVIIGARRDGFGAAINHLLSRSISRNLTGHRGHRPVLVVPRNAVRPHRKPLDGESERHAHT